MSTNGITAADTTTPSGVAEDLARLSSALDGTIPPRREDNLLVSTWNLGAFADLTATWEAGPALPVEADVHGLREPVRAGAHQRPRNPGGRGEGLRGREHAAGAQGGSR